MTESRDASRHRFATVTTQAFTEDSSTAGGGYRRSRPGDGFDRLTANRTNYRVELPGAGTEGSWKSAAHDSMRRGRASDDRARDPVYRPRSDGPVGYDIVTGREADPGRTYHPTGARRSDDRAIVTRTMTATVDPSRGEEVPLPRARNRPVPVTVRAPLGTLAAVRPPTPGGEDFYATFRR